MKTIHPSGHIEYSDESGFEEGMEKSIGRFMFWHFGVAVTVGATLAYAVVKLIVEAFNWIV